MCVWGGGEAIKKSWAVKTCINFKYQNIIFQYSTSCPKSHVLSYKTHIYMWIYWIYIERSIYIVLELIYRENITLTDFYSTPQLNQTSYELQCNAMSWKIIFYNSLYFIAKNISFFIINNHLVYKHIKIVIQRPFYYFIVSFFTFHIIFLSFLYKFWAGDFSEMAHLITFKLSVVMSRYLNFVPPRNVLKIYFQSKLLSVYDFKKPILSVRFLKNK